MDGWIRKESPDFDLLCFFFTIQDIHFIDCTRVVNGSWDLGIQGR